MTIDQQGPDDGSTFDRLRKLMVRCGKNKNDRAIAVISACIMEGFDTRPRIIGALKHLGFNPRHAAMILNDGTGRPDSHWWHRDADGRYSLHEVGPNS